MQQETTQSESIAGERDAQRTALRDLVALSAEAANTEVEIASRHRTQLQLAARQLDKSLAEIEQRFEQRQREIHAEYEQRVGATTAEFEKTAGEIRFHEASTRQKTDLQNDAIVGEIKHKLQQAVWLAESVFEGTQAQVAKDYKKAKETHAARLIELDEMQARGVSLLNLFGQPELANAIAPAPQGKAEAAADEAPLSEAPKPPAPTESYETLRDLAQQRIDTLDHLQVPRLFVGVWPFVITVILCGLGVAIGQFAVNGIPSDFTTMQPQWKGIGYGFGIAFAICIGIGIVLRMMGRAHVREAYAQCRTALQNARIAADAKQTEARANRDAQLARATRKRDAEVNAAKEQAKPLQARAVKNYETAMNSFKSEITLQMERVSRNRAQQSTVADEWLQKSLDENQKQREQDIASAQALHDRTVKENDDEQARNQAELSQRWNDGLTRIQTPIESRRAGIHSGNGQVIEDWTDPRWTNWTPPREFPRQIRFGQLGVDLKQITDKYPRDLELPPTFSVPGSLSFPNHASLLIHTDHAGRPQAIQTQQMLMARLLTQIPPGRVRFTIIDPVGLGQNFAGFMHLADHDEALVGSRIWTESEHIEQQLSNLTEHMETVIQKYLRNEFATIDEYNAQAGELAEPYRYLIIADFPVGFEGDAFRRLNSIASSGARCGVFFIVVRDLRKPIPSGAHLDELEAHSINLIRKGDAFIWKDEIFKQFPLSLDPPPNEEFLTQILDVVGQRAKEAKRVEVAFETIAPPLDRIWSGDSKDDLVVPIGRLGATRLQNMRLGRGVAQHVLIAGKTGSGKSTLLHILVTNLALWYGPDQVEFYLVDFKKGVEFKTYATHQLPHARAIAVESDREFGLSVLQRIDAELTRRGEMFRKLGVQDLAGFRQASKQSLPRTLLMIDEFQEFFSEDDKLAQEASLLLDRLVRQGRAFGIHVLLGSQTIGGTSGLARSTIGQMAVRIALQTSEADSQLILGDSNSAARLLSRPGEAIYNDAGGLVEGNSPFQISWLAEETREVYLDKIRELAQQKKNNQPEPVVFEGNAPADITRNKELAKLIEAPLAAASRLSAPLVWLGDPVAIKSPTSVAFRAQSGSNMLIIGQHDEAAMALISAAMISLAAQYPTNSAKFYLLDGTAADSSLTGTLQRITAALSIETKHVEWRVIPETIAEIADEVHRRQAAERQDFPTIYLFIYGLQRYRMLRKTEESFGFSSDDAEKKPQPDKLLADILREGPALGVHVIAWIDTAASIERTFDRGAMREFDHRILFQMSAADSSNLIDSPLANKLGFHRALAYSEELGVMEKFRPYALPTKQWLAHVQDQLKKR